MYTTIFIRLRTVIPVVRNSEACRKFGAIFVLIQGLATAIVPQLSIEFIKSMIGMNFENAAELEATPAYLRQLRAIGVGMVAAAGTDLLLQWAGGTDASAPEIDESDGAGDGPADGQ
jgi:hypothetical protein